MDTIFWNSLYLTRSFPEFSTLPLLTFSFNIFDTWQKVFEGKKIFEYFLLIKPYLSDRHFLVRVSSSFLNTTNINVGVPRGSSLQLYNIICPSYQTSSSKTSKYLGQILTVILLSYNERRFKETSRMLKISYIQFFIQANVDLRFSTRWGNAKKIKCY